MEGLATGLRGREGGWPPTRAGRRAHRGPEGPRPGPPAGFRQPPARRCARPASRAEERPYAHSPAHARERADRLARTAKAAGRRSPAVSGGACATESTPWLVGYPDRTGVGSGAGRGGPPPTSYGGRAWPIPPAGPPPSELRRAIRRDRPGRSDLAGRRPARRDTPTPGRGTRVLPPAGSARWCPAAPSRPQPGTTNPSRKLSSLSKGSWCRRAAAGRAAGGAAQGPMRNTSPDRAPRTSHKLVSPWGRAGSADRRTPPGQLWQQALPVPPMGPPPSELRRTLVTSARTSSDPAGRNADRERSAGAPGGRPGGLQTSLGKNGSSQGRFAAPPLGRRDHEAPRPQDGTGSTRSAGGCVRPATSAGSRTRRTRRGGRGAASLAAGDDPRDQGGAVGDRRGLQTSLGKNVLFKGGLQPPPGGPGLKAVLERPCSPIPCDEGEDLLKGGRSRGISGRSADWRCIHSHFPVKNQVIP